MAASLQQENNELKQRLRTFGAIMHLTKDAFASKDITSLGVHIVNNTRALLQFDRSVLLDTRGGKVVLTAEYALSSMNEHSQYALNMKKFAPEGFSSGAARMCYSSPSMTMSSAVTV